MQVKLHVGTRAAPDFNDRLYIYNMAVLCSLCCLQLLRPRADLVKRLVQTFSLFFFATDVLEYFPSKACVLGVQCGACEDVLQ